MDLPTEVVQQRAAAVGDTAYAPPRGRGSLCGVGQGGNGGDEDVGEQHFLFYFEKTWEVFDDLEGGNQYLGLLL